jgi:DNA polymerase III delta prime subunit
MVLNDRQQMTNDIKELILNFDNICLDINHKKGIYIYGAPGCGKTTFVEKIIKDLNYDMIKYDAGDIRNKNLIESLTSNHIASQNVLDMMRGVKRKIVIVMDEIDGMNSGDKGGISSLIKLIRQKKTKKQKGEQKTNIPIICIGNYFMDKKIKELMKVSTTFELKQPSVNQITNYLKKEIPNYKGFTNSMKKTTTEYIQQDLRKMNMFKQIYQNNEQLMNENSFNKIFQKKQYNDDAKKITHELFNNHVSIDKHIQFMNETERTIVALLWHENVIDNISVNKDVKKCVVFYNQILNNICYADYIDRITFQYQIWQFNEMSSLMKTFHNNKLYHDNFKHKKCDYNDNIRFTKVLTKYSTEYNNSVFITNLCLKLSMDKKDLFTFFQEMRKKYGDINKNENIGRLEKKIEEYDICRLDIKRIYRYLDKNIKKDDVKKEDE